MMKMKPKTLDKLSIILMMCGLTLFIFTGCSSYEAALTLNSRAYILYASWA